jgi:hypothetical protein
MSWPFDLRRTPTTVARPAPKPWCVALDHIKARRAVFELIAAISAMVSLFVPSWGNCSVLEEFKAFINEKPTIEVFEFRVRTVKNRLKDVDPSTYRLFAATYQEGVGYSILEDRSALPTKIFKSFLVGGYGGEHWHSFNGSNVIVENSKCTGSA